jgi:hypothetical protein
MVLCRVAAYPRGSGALDFEIAVSKCIAIARGAGKNPRAMVRLCGLDGWPLLQLAATDSPQIG